MRVYAISDLHSDFAENRQLIRRLSRTAYSDDALIVAGDIADRIETISETLSDLRERFRKVFYVPGNHELWVRDHREDSISKLHRILELCDRLEVRTRPDKAGAVWIVPLLSWYHPSFDDQEIADAEELHGWVDFHFCHWPEGVEPLDDYFACLNEPHIKAYDCPIISFSHFLPRRDLLPGVERLRFKGLPRVAGSTRVDEQIRRLGSAIHVFGHSHINRDLIIDGIRYVQNALSYPRERRSDEWPAKVIWDSEGNNKRVGLLG